MKTALCSLIGGILVFASQNALAQTTPAGDCCRPEATAKIAASAAFVDIVGIKLGMPAEQALAAVKAANPAFTINMVKIDLDWDYLAKRIIGSRTGPKKQWVYGIQGAVDFTEARGGETIQAALTLPPSPQVVFNLTRTVFFPKQATPTVENVVAGLKKKYGPPTAEQLIGIPQLNWFFDSQGHLIEESQLRKGPLAGCQGMMGEGLPVWDLSPPASGFRGKTRVAGGLQCDSLVTVQAEVSPATTGGNMAAQ